MPYIYTKCLKHIHTYYIHTYIRTYLHTYQLLFHVILTRWKKYYTTYKHACLDPYAFSGDRSVHGALREKKSLAI